jgi:hypothetical protein
MVIRIEIDNSHVPAQVSRHLEALTKPGAYRRHLLPIINAMSTEDDGLVIAIEPTT